MMLALLLGVGAGLGLCLLVAGLAPAPFTLASRLQHHDLPPAHQQQLRSSPHVHERAAGSRRQAWLIRAPWLRHSGLLDRLAPDAAPDLAVTGTPASLHAADKMLGALVGLAAPVLLAVLLAATGFGPPLLVPLWLSLLLGTVGFLLPDLRLRQRARDARREFRSSISAFLDLVAMRLASGSGLAEALHDAASIGTGPAFAQLRGALADARTDALTPAQALARLGDQLHLPDLVEVATRLRLSDSSGAQAQTSLRAQAASLRDRDLSDAQGQANEQSQSMLVAQVVLGLGFVLFLGYPAVVRVLAT